DGHPVLARQGPYLASSFHPELADDPRLHGYFLNLIAAGGGGG
ncbi:MAG: pyridoxal 5'-phosphate synthase glutaminase subunit PdxT, partial [Firmicutes bacterium]|nr:pyridoxal 5'-phosphate synthase glutaminase subunit PdxT [Bacillota bacterium]